MTDRPIGYSRLWFLRDVVALQRFVDKLWMQVVVVPPADRLLLTGEKHRVAKRWRADAEEILSRQWTGARDELPVVVGTPFGIYGTDRIADSLRAGDWVAVGARSLLSGAYAGIGVYRWTGEGLDEPVLDFRHGRRGRPDGRSARDSFCTVIELGSDEPEPQPPARRVVGDAGGYLLVLRAEEAEQQASAREVVDSARTFDEALSRMPGSYRDSLEEDVSHAQEAGDDDVESVLGRWATWNLWPEAEMFADGELLPTAVGVEVGIVWDSMAMDREVLHIPAERKDQLVAALERHGFEVVVDDDLARRVAGRP